MCYSVKTSIISYTLGIIAGIFALFTRQIVLGLLILAYSQMQFSELLIWYGIDTKNDNLNRFGTSYGKYLLATHNIAIGIGIILSIIFMSKKKLKITDFIPLAIGILFFMYIVFFYYLPKKYPDITLPLDPSCKDNTNKCQNPNNRLNWAWPHKWYLAGYVISCVILIIYIKPTNSKILLGLVFTVSLIASYIFNPKVIGSIWCFNSAILAPILVIVNYMLIKNLNSSDILT
jgi:hypothetical protein